MSILDILNRRGANPVLAAPAGGLNKLNPVLPSIGAPVGGGPLSALFSKRLTGAPMQGFNTGLQLMQSGEARWL